MKKSFFLIACVLAPSLASAAGGHHEAAFDFWNFLGHALNFIIFAAVIWWAGRKSLNTFFADRSQELMKAVVDAQELLDQAKEIHDKVAERKTRLDEEVEGIMDGASRRAKEQADAILQDAKSQANRNMDNARRTVEAEISKQISQLRAEMVERSVTLAEKLIRERLDDTRQMGLVERFFDGLDQSEGIRS